MSQCYWNVLWLNQASFYTNVLQATPILYSLIIYSEWIYKLLPYLLFTLSFLNSCLIQLLSSYRALVTCFHGYSMPHLFQYHFMQYSTAFHNFVFCSFLWSKYFFPDKFLKSLSYSLVLCLKSWLAFLFFTLHFVELVLSFMSKSGILAFDVCKIHLLIFLLHAIFVSWSITY